MKRRLIDPEADIEVPIVRHSIVVAVTDEVRARRVRDAAELANRQYEGVFRRLAE